MKRLTALLIACTALAETLRVPQDFPTIQTALDSLADGDTVLVAVDVYAEALVAPPLSFVLRGDVIPDTGDYPRPVVDPSSLPGSQTLACLSTGAPPVVVEDFVFRNGAEMYPRTIYDVGGIADHSQEMILRRCVFDSTWEALSPCPGRITLEDCRFEDVQEYAVSTMQSPQARLQATDCSFTGLGPFSVYCRDSTQLVRCEFSHRSGGTRGPFLMGWDTARDVTIRECVFGPMFPSIYVPIELWTVNGRIEDNIFENMHTGLTVLSLRCACEDPTFIRGNLFVNIDPAPEFSLTNFGIELQCDSISAFAAVIENNTMINCTGSDSMGKAIRLYAGARILGNHFQSLEPSFNRTIFQNGYRAGTEAHCNRFDHTGHAYYAWPAPPDPVDARFNWWGDSTGPYHPSQNPFGLGDTVSDGVDFDPWCPDTNCSESAPQHAFLLSPSSFLLSCYPNPFNSTLHLTLIPSQIGIVKVELFDILGRKVSEIWHGPLAYRKDVSFDASSLASGIYFARVTDVISRKNLAVAKLVLLK